MRNALLICKLEMRIFFTSPIMYVIAGVFLIISGYLFFDLMTTLSLVSTRAINLDKTLKAQDISANVLVFSQLFSYMGFLLVLIMPLMTMRLLAEEKKTGTIELLFTFPITDLEIVAGKLIATACLIICLLAITLIYPLMAGAFGEVSYGTICSGYLGLLLQCLVLMSLGLFASALTENQIIAATITYGVVLLLASVRWSVPYAPKPWDGVLDYLAISTHSAALIQGVLDSRDVIYYVLVATLFIWLTLQGLKQSRAGQ